MEGTTCSVPGVEHGAGQTWFPSAMARLDGEILAVSAALTPTSSFCTVMLDAEPSRTTVVGEDEGARRCCCLSKGPGAAAGGVLGMASEAAGLEVWPGAGEGVPGMSSGAAGPEVRAAAGREALGMSPRAAGPEVQAAAEL